MNSKSYKKGKEMKTIVLVAKGFLIVCGGLTIIIMGLFCIISSGRIDPFLDENNELIENSIAEKIKIDINGAKNGLIIRGKSLENPILLFVSSGPGTSDYFLSQEYPAMNLEEYFTVCYWDYRGMCLVYDKELDPKTITTEQIQEDTLEVTKYLKERFNKDKIYIMGFSGGTHIAIKAANLYPDQYLAYFAMSQVVASDEDRDTLVYQYMKKTFAVRGDKSSINKLESLVEHLEDGRVKNKDWYQFVYLLHEAGGGTIKDKSELEGIVIPILKARCYTMIEKVNYIRGMKMYRTTPFFHDMEKIDYRDEQISLQIPVYFISGEYDYNCPWPLVEDYCNKIEAPSKEFLLVPNAAHSPLWENSKVVVEYMVSKIK